MNNNFPFSYQILVIDDDVETTTLPYYFELQDNFGNETISWFENPKDCLEYLQINLLKRTVVILDYGFRSPDQNGYYWFKEIQKTSSLLYVILFTNRRIEEIAATDLKGFINDNLMAIIFKNDDDISVKIVQSVEKGLQYLGNQIDCILEEWILRHQKFTREEPYMYVDGREMSLNDLLKEIRLHTPFGKQMVNSIISTIITTMRLDAEKLNKKGS